MRTSFRPVVVAVLAMLATALSASITAAAEDTVGLVDPTTGIWSLRADDGATYSFYFGNPGDVPFAGDWDCDGVDTPGLYRQSDGYVYLRNTNDQGNANIAFFFGNPGDVPIAGDFNGDGCDTVSVYRPSQSRVFIINELGSADTGLGSAQLDYYFGNPGDLPFTGDFNNDGIDTIGLYRGTSGLMYFRNIHSQGTAEFEFFFGDPGDLFVGGDWTGDGTDSPGIFRPSQSIFYLKYSNTQGNADEQFAYGNGSMRPVAGKWGDIPAISPPPPGTGWNYVGVQDPSAINTTLTSSFGYEPWGYDPATIPVPGSNTHYVDNTATNCSDSGNGTVVTPRCSIPTNLPAGSVVQIEGGPYPGPTTITATGTASQPVFIHGDGIISGVASNDHAIEIRGSSHLIIDGLTFDGSTIVTGQLGNGPYSISGDSDHITVRNSSIRNYPDPLERPSQPGRSTFFANTFITDASYIAIINNDFTDIGTYPPSYETGKHLIAGGSDTSWVWIVGNKFTRGSEDAIQIRANSDATPNRFWTIAGNTIESMGENAIDVKTGSDVIISSNTVCDFRPVTFANGSGSGGVAFVFNNDNGGPRESWLINNTITTCSGSGGTDGTVNIGFMMQSASGTNYIVGNLFDQTVSRGMWIGSGSVPVIEMNTIYAPGDDGILISYSGFPGGSVVGNIVVDPPDGEDAINLNQTYMQGWAQDNVLFDPDGPVGEKNVDAAQNLVDVDPRLVNPGADNFSLAPGSPALGAVNPSPSAWSAFVARYGFSIAFDLDGNPRTSPVSAGAHHR